MPRQDGDKGSEELAPVQELSSDLAPVMEPDLASASVNVVSEDNALISAEENDDASQLPETVPSRFPDIAVETDESIKELTSSSSQDSSEDEDGNDKVMSVFDHLDELRTRLIRSLFVFALAMGLGFTFGRDIIGILEIPANGMHFQALSIEEPVLVYFKVSFYAALALSAPYFLFEISSFVGPGLRRNERRVLAPIVIGGPLLFATGAFFCYKFVLPPMLAFFNSFSGPIAPVQQRLDYYISLVTTMIFYMGICFQLPIVLFALALAGLINSRQLFSFWRYAIVGASLVAAIITPDPTVISMLIVMGALLGLYFFTVILLKLFGR